MSSQGTYPEGRAGGRKDGYWGHTPPSLSRITNNVGTDISVPCPQASVCCHLNFDVDPVHPCFLPRMIVHFFQKRFCENLRFDGWREVNSRDVQNRMNRMDLFSVLDWMDHAALNLPTCHWLGCSRALKPRRSASSAALVDEPGSDGPKTLGVPLNFERSVRDNSMKSSGSAATQHGDRWLRPRHSVTSPGAAAQPEGALNSSTFHLWTWNPHSQRKRSSLLDFWSVGGKPDGPIPHILLTFRCSPCRPRTVSKASFLSHSRWPSETA